LVLPIVIPRRAGGPSATKEEAKQVAGVTDDSDSRGFRFRVAGALFGAAPQYAHRACGRTELDELKVTDQACGWRRTFNRSEPAHESTSRARRCSRDCGGHRAGAAHTACGACVRRAPFRLYDRLGESRLRRLPSSHVETGPAREAHGPCRRAAAIAAW